MRKSKALLASVGLLSLMLVMSGCLGIFAKSGQVEGVVQYDDGTPIAGAQVKLGSVGTTTTNDDGAFVLRNVKHDTYKLTVTVAGDELATQNVVVDKKLVNVEVKIEKGEHVAMVAGSVVWEHDGMSVADATVNIAGITATTDASGEYILEGVPYGLRTYTVTIGTILVGEGEVEIDEPEVTLPLTVVRNPKMGVIFFHSDDTDTWNIYSMNADGSNVQQLTFSDKPHSYPRASEDGTMVTYETTKDGLRNIYVINSDGSGERALTTKETEDRHPAFSPDGQYVAFHSRYPAGGLHTDWEIYIVNIDGTGRTRLTNAGGTDAWPFFSPDGQKIGYFRGGQVWIMNADGTGHEQLTNSATTKEKGHWSPDGSTIVFGAKAGTPAQWDIYTVDVATGVETQLTNDAHEDTVPVWSPDGSKILFSSNRGGRNALYTMNPDGTDLELVYESTKRVEYGSWVW